MSDQIRELEALERAKQGESRIDQFNQETKLQKKMEKQRQKVLNQIDEKDDFIEEDIEVSNQEEQGQRKIFKEEQQKPSSAFDDIFGNIQKDIQPQKQQEKEDIKKAFMSEDQRYKNQFNSEDSNSMMNVLSILKQQPQQAQPTINTFKKVDIKPQSFSNQPPSKQTIIEKDESIRFFLLDFYEDPSLKNQLILTGKVFNKQTQQFESISIIIKNMLRKIYFVPKEFVSEQENFQAFENECISRLKQIMNKQNNFQFNAKQVKRKYAFELDLPRELSTYLKVQYSFEHPTLPSDFQGKFFECVIGTTYTASELFILKKQLKGPMWMEISGKYNFTTRNQSFTKYEVTLNNYNYIDILEEQLEAPPLKVMSIALKKHQKNKNKQEIVQISAAIYETNLNNTKYQDNNIEYISYVRPISNNLPNLQNQPHIKIVKNEATMYNIMIAKILEYDPDVFLSHDLYQNSFDAIFNGLKENKIAWQKFGRIVNHNRNNFPSGRLQQKIRELTKGRLVVDTYLCSKELAKDLDYTLQSLAKNQLDFNRQEFQNDSIEQCFKTQDGLLTVINHTQIDCQLQIRLMLKLQILPLTKQLTNIAGNIWNNSLLNKRAERNEMLLMHHFNFEKYIIPDKFYDNFEEDNAPKSKKPKYQGGFVLEPKPGLYENYIILLDFNSLYPSIIQEFNICFTTINRPSINLQEYIKKQKIKTTQDDDEEKIPEVPENIEEQAILPRVISMLVEARKAVKKQMQKETNQELKQVLDVKQLAFKLVANSIYGCLGFGSSRFYAQPIASLITYQGRRILQDSIKIVEELDYQVVYGDTDSLMINPKQQQLGEAMRVGSKIKQAVSKKYKKLVFDIDGVFKSLLLLRKKKYSALVLKNLQQVLSNFQTNPVWQTEIKGLDIIRRDWCDLSRNTGRDILNIIINNNAQDHDIMTSRIYEYLAQLNKKINNNQVQFKDFIITKQLTKNPHNYPDSKSLPHVKVALDMVNSGQYSPEGLIGHTIYFVICKGSEKENLSQKAFNPRLVKQNNLQIDFDYYKKSQILQPLLRMVENIDQISSAQMASSLGLNEREFLQTNNQQTNEQEVEADFSNEVSGIYFKFENRMCCYKGVYTEKQNLFQVEFPDVIKTIEPLLLKQKIQMLIRQKIKEYYLGYRKCQNFCSDNLDNQLKINIDLCPNNQCQDQTIRLISSNKINKDIEEIKKIFNYSKVKQIEDKIKESPIALQICDDILSYLNQLQQDSAYNKINLTSLFKQLRII